MRALKVLVLPIAAFAVPAARAADCNSNGIPDIEEIRSGALPDCNGTGVPDSCDVLPVNYGLVSGGTFFVGPSPQDVLAEDLDTDGDADVATADTGAAGVSVLWNDGLGRFSSHELWFAKVSAGSLAPGDFDGDGRKDLAVGGVEGVAVLFQAPGRRFVTREPFLPLDIRMHFVASGDLDDDGDIDLATTVSFGVKVLRNEGKGSFVALDTIPIGSDPLRIVAGRLDADADLDLATSNAVTAPTAAGNVSILLNQGDATFATARNFATGSGPAAITAADLDGDGDMDLATGNTERRDITVLLGEGSGRFNQSTSIAARQMIQGMASADMDGDGDVDLVASGFSDNGEPGAAVFLNHGRAEFSRPVRLATGFHPFAVAAADMDGDGSRDLVLSDLGVSAVTVLQESRVAYSMDCNSNGAPDDCELEGNDCNGNRFLDACDVSSGASPDCDRDGRPDECQTDCNGNGIADPCDIASGAGPDCNRNGALDPCDLRGGNFGAFEFGEVPMKSSPVGLLSAHDLDGDGRTDLFAAADAGDLLVLWSTAQGFLPEARFPGAQQIADFAAADLDGDGDGDVVAADPVRGLVVFKNHGDRSFGAEIPPVPLPEGVFSVIAGDLDNDSEVDLAAFSAQGFLFVLENQGAGVLGSPLKLPGASAATFVLDAADLDGDGWIDLAGADAAGTVAIAIRWNAGAFRFDVATQLPTGVIINAIGLVDIDSDKDVDIAVTNGNSLLIFQNAGARAFSGPVELPHPGITGVLPGDLDGDGDNDIIATQFTFSVIAFRNVGNGSFEPPLSILGFDGLFGQSGMDFDGDRLLDLALLRSFTCFDCPQPQLFQILTLRNLAHPAPSKDLDANGVPDECQPRPFHRGDADGDGQVNLTDAVFTLRHLFQGDPAPACREAADSNNDTRLEITDAVVTLEFLFRSGAPPAPPGPPPAPCGMDTDAPGSAGDIGCGHYPGCRGG